MFGGRICLSCDCDRDVLEGRQPGGPHQPEPSEDRCAVATGIHLRRGASFATASCLRPLRHAFVLPILELRLGASRRRVGTRMNAEHSQRQAVPRAFSLAQVAPVRA